MKEVVIYYTEFFTGIPPMTLSYISPGFATPVHSPYMGCLYIGHKCTSIVVHHSLHGLSVYGHDDGPDHPNMSSNQASSSSATLDVGFCVAFVLPLLGRGKLLGIDPGRGRLVRDGDDEVASWIAAADDDDDLFSSFSLPFSNAM